MIIFIEALKKHMRSFIRCIPTFLKTYLSLISLMIFYSILGLHFLKGLDENRCRLTEEPINNKWLADDNIKNFCGEWQCPAELSFNQINYLIFKFLGHFAKILVILISQEITQKWNLWSLIMD